MIGNGSAQHPALANGIGPLINQEFRIVFQRAVVHSIRVEGLGIPQCRFIKYTLGSIQEAYPQILSGSHDYKMGAILSADQALEQLPRKVENPEPKRVLRGYFHIRSQKKKVAKSITVYQDAAERFGE